MPLYRVAPFELHPTSFYWAHFDNVLATGQMSRRPFSKGLFRRWLNFSALFAQEIVAPGICIYKHKIAKHLMMKDGYDFLLEDGVLVPLLPKDAASFTELDYADRHDATSYRVKQDEKVIEFTQFLDTKSRLIVVFDGEEYRKELTENFEETLLMSSYLKQPLFNNLSKDILRSVREHSIGQDLLRRSSFFFTGDRIAKVSAEAGREIKRRASQIYHNTFADHISLRAWLPETYAGRQAMPLALSLSDMLHNFEEHCFISFEEFDYLRAADIRFLRRSSSGSTYFLRAQKFRENECSREEFENSLQRYAITIKDYIVSRLSDHKHPRKSRVYDTGRFVHIMGIAVPIVVYAAVFGLEKLVKAGPLFGLAGVGAEIAWHLVGAHKEKWNQEIESADRTIAIMEWEKRRRENHREKDLLPML